MQDPNRFQRFVPKADNVQEPISAQDVNAMQKLLEHNQRLLFQIRDEDFKQNCQYVLEHHPAVNTLYMDLFKDSKKIDLYESREVTFDENERAITFDPNSTALNGVVYSKIYVNPSRIPIADILMMSECYIPAGCSIKFQVSNNGGADFFDINPNGRNPLLHMETEGISLMIRAELDRPDVNNSPRIENWGMLWWDPTIGLITLPGGGTQGELPGEGNPGWEPEQPPTGDSGIVVTQGAKYHKELLEIGPDDHHSKDHQHGKDDVSYVNLGTDVIGILGSEHWPIELGGTAPVLGNTWLIREGDTPIAVDAPTNDVIFIRFESNPEGAWEDLTGRMKAVVSIPKGDEAQCSITGMLYRNMLNEKSQRVTAFAGVQSDIMGKTENLIDIVKERYGGLVDA